MTVIPTAVRVAPALEAPAAPDLRKTRDKAGILHYLTPEQMAEEIVRLDARLAAAPQAPAAPVADEREAFEAFMRKDTSGFSLNREGESYEEFEVATYWHVWKARAALAVAQATPAAPAVDAMAPVQALLDMHAELLDANPDAYFSLAFMRETGWMAWITDKPFRGPIINPDRQVLARGQGDTPAEACADAAQTKEGGVAA